MNEEKFTGLANIYDKYRSSYPDELINTLFIRTNAENVIDIGAGTGIFTRCLLKKSWNVTAVEPNHDMFKVLQDTLGNNVKLVNATAENTSIDDSSYDLITAAQAFHWFDEDLFKNECIRLLKPNGKVAIIWNGREYSDLTAERNIICKKYCGLFHRGHTGKRSYIDGDTFLKNEYFSEVDFFEFDNSRQLSEDDFIGDNLSRSYALKKTDSNYNNFVEELRNLFHKYEKNNMVLLPLKTTCYIGSF